MPEPVAAEPPSRDDSSDDAPARLRQPPPHLGHAYRVAFVETGALEVVLPATEPVPVQRPARPSPRTTAAATATATARRTTTRAAVPAQRTARPSAPAPAEVPAASADTGGQLARRSRVLLLGVAVGVVLGVLAVVLTGLLVASLGLLPR